MTVITYKASRASNARNRQTFGSLSANAISALSGGVRLGGFYHDTGEEAISPYCRRGGDLVWEIGSGYFGCRHEDRRFRLEMSLSEALPLVPMP